MFSFLAVTSSNTWPKYLRPDGAPGYLFAFLQSYGNDKKSSRGRISSLAFITSSGFTASRGW